MLLEISTCLVNLLWVLPSTTKMKMKITRTAVQKLFMKGCIALCRWWSLQTLESPLDRCPLRTLTPISPLTPIRINPLVPTLPNVVNEEKSTHMETPLSNSHQIILLDLVPQPSGRTFRCLPNYSSWETTISRNGNVLLKPSRPS